MFRRSDADANGVCGYHIGWNIRTGVLKTVFAERFFFKPLGRPDRLYLGVGMIAR